MNGWPKPALWTQRGVLVSGRMMPEPKAHASGEGKFCSVRRFLRTKPGLRWSVPYSHGECWNPRNFVRAAVVLADRGLRLPRSSLGVSDLFLGRAGRPKPGSFEDSFWRRPWPLIVSTRPLPRRGCCDAINRRRFVHHQLAKHSGGDVTQSPKPSSDVM